MAIDSSFDSFLEFTPFPAYIKSKDGRYKNINKKFEDFFELPRESIVGKTAFDILPQEIAQEYKKFDEAILENPSEHQFAEYRFCTKHNSTHREIVLYKKVIIENGEIVAILGYIIHDKTV